MSSRSSKRFFSFFDFGGKILLSISFFLNGMIGFYNIPTSFSPLLKAIITIVAILTVLCLYYVLDCLPKKKKERELSYRPKGNPDLTYFSTSPRENDNYGFFSNGYEPYYNWLKSPRSQILFLTGVSGSGKSSLINAYLKPALESNPKIKNKVFIIRSYSNPLFEISQAINAGQIVSDDINADALLAQIKNLGTLLSNEEKAFLILDQFEEFFLLTNSTVAFWEKDSEPKEFVELKTFFLSFIRNPPSGVYLLLSYRSDFQEFIDKLELPALNQNINWRQVNPLNFPKAKNFIENCPGLKIPKNQIARVLKEAASISTDTQITYRPIVLNFLGIILQQMVGLKDLPKEDDMLIKNYIKECLGTEIVQERVDFLKAMITDFNTSKPRKLLELQRISNLTSTQLDNQLRTLQQKGLVRCLDNDEKKLEQRTWQIAHDFIALQIEKVIYGVKPNNFKLVRPWILPLLSIFTLSFFLYYGIYLVKTRKKDAIEHLSNAGFVWNEKTKKLSGTALSLTDTAILRLSTDIAALQPDTLTILNDYAPVCFKSLSFLSQITSLKKVTISNPSLTSITDLSKLNNLVELDLTTRADFKDIENLTQIKGLKQLGLHCNIENLNSIQNLINLTNLDLSGCSRLTDISAIKKNPNLTFLNLKSCSYLIDITPIEGLINLQSLDLSSCYSLKDLAVLKNLKQLDNLVLTYCSGISTFDWLNALANLKSLNLAGCFGLKNLEAFRNLENLTKLDLSVCNGLTNLNGIEYLKNIDTIILGGCDYLINIDSLENLTKLKKIDFSDCYSFNNYNIHIDNVSSLKKLKNLTDLDLNGLINLKDVSALINLKNLVSLKLKSRYLVNLKDLQYLSKLESLDISSCTSLTDISDIEQLKKLKSLDISVCNDIKDIRALEKLKNLEILTLPRVDSSINLSPLKSLTNLKIVRIPLSHGLDKNYYKIKELLPKSKIETSETINF